MKNTQAERTLERADGLQVRKENVSQHLEAGSQIVLEDVPRASWTGVRESMGVS